MTTMQDRVKRAINATAEQITADSIPPFIAPQPARRLAKPPASTPAIRRHHPVDSQRKGARRRIEPRAPICLHGGFSGGR